MKTSLRQWLSRSLGLSNPVPSTLRQGSGQAPLREPDPRLDSLESKLAASDVPVPPMSGMADRIWAEAERRAAAGKIITFKPRQSMLRRALPLAAAAGLALAAGAWFLLRGAGAMGLDGSVAAGNATLAPGDRTLSPGKPFTLQPGDTLRAADGARVDLTLSDKGRFVFDGPGDLALDRLSGAKLAATLRLARGHLAVDIVPGTWSALEIATPHARLAVVGTAFTVDVDADRTLVTVSRGRVRAAAAGDAAKALELEAGKSATIHADRVEPGAATNRLPSTSLRDHAQGARSGQASLRERTGFRERVRLVNGMVLTGRIVAQDGETLTLQTANGTLTVKRTQVKAVEIIKE